MPLPSKLSVLSIGQAIAWTAKLTGASREDAASALHDALRSGFPYAEHADGRRVSVLVWRNVSVHDFLEWSAYADVEWGWDEEAGDDCRHPVLRRELMRLGS